MISTYGDDREAGLKHWRMTGKPYFDRHQVKVHGLFVGDFVEKYQPQFLAEMAGWVKDGLVKYKEDFWDGLEQAPKAFSTMLSGGNFGKTIVKVSDDPTTN